jgi:methionine synthase II (cobalamin-independent)
MNLKDDNNGPYSTVVGSFPLENTEENLARTIKDQIEIGIDYVCYGQLIDMISQFLSPLSQKIQELTQKNNHFYLCDDFKLPQKPVAVEYGDFLVNFVNKNQDMKAKTKGLKACLTGPFTLASEVILTEKLAEGVRPLLFNEPRAIMVDWIVDKFAEIMGQIGKVYSEMGINIISMDEPILSLLIGKRIMFHSEDFLIRTLNKAISGIKELSSIHVCGEISPKVRDILLETNVNILDHEFQTNPKNFEIFQEKHFTKKDKFLAFGAVKTKFKPIKNGTLSDYVESVPEIQSSIQKAIDLYGKENLFIKPDCGFMPLKDSFGEGFAYQIVLGKLKNMISALNSIQ